LFFKNEIKISDSRFKRILFRILGFTFIGLGTIGIFLPVLPTTIFFLLASVCFAKSSERFYNWLLTNRIFGKYIKDYLEGRTIPLRTKIFSIAFLWIGISSSAIFFVENYYIKILLFIIAILVTIHIASVGKPKANKNQNTDLFF
jgi:uncharacterized protein